MGERREARWSEAISRGREEVKEGEVKEREEERSQLSRIEERTRRVERKVRPHLSPNSCTFSFANAST